MKKLLQVTIGLSLTFLLMGCASSVRTRASYDLQCQKEKIKVEQISFFGQSYEARGCDKRASYVMNNNWQIFLNSPVQKIGADASEDNKSGENFVSDPEMAKSSSPADIARMPLHQPGR
jgi:hypothetical protein